MSWVGCVFVGAAVQGCGVGLDEVDAVAAALNDVPAWQKKVAAPSPGTRYGHALVYDAARRETVLFSGDGKSGRNNETWTWNGTAWRKKSPSKKPAARCNASAAFDSARNVVVLFGGDTCAVTEPEFAPVDQKTFEWNGANWAQKSSTGPAKRTGAGMAYDVARGKTVLFGGSGARVGGRGTFLNDTWEWNGSTWTRVATPAAPSARTGVGMVYDSARAKIVLFGGMEFRPGGNGHLADTWEYDGATWTKIETPILPQPLAEHGLRLHGMTFDSCRGKTVVFGGEQTWGYGSPDLFMYDGAAWTQVTGLPADLWARRSSPLAFDKDRCRGVLHGGWVRATGTKLGDTWETY